MMVYRHLHVVAIVLLALLRISVYVGTRYPVSSTGVSRLVLWLIGSLGKGTLRAYPWGRIPTLVAIQDWLGINIVSVNVINDHEQLVSPVGLHRELAG